MAETLEFCQWFFSWLVPEDLGLHRLGVKIQNPEVWVQGTHWCLQYLEEIQGWEAEELGQIQEV